jgi:MFS transporter, ACS family, D-galactonate transporter
MLRSSGTWPPQRRWRIAWLLGFGVLVNYFDRVTLSVSHAALYTAIGISDITFEYLSGAYSWTYAMCQLPVNVLLDRFSVRRRGRISTFLWSLASFAAAMTPTLTGFFAARLLLGVGEAPTFPANTKAIGAWFPSRERGFATEIFDAASRFASAIGVPLIGILLLEVGWRWSFVATGLVSLMYFFLFSKLYRDPDDDPNLTNIERRYIADSSDLAATRDGQPERAFSGYLIRQRKVLGFTLGFGPYNYVYYLLLTWLPSYLSTALHIDLLRSSVYTGVPWLFATVTDLAGGWTVDALIQRGWDTSSVRRVILFAGTAFGLGILGAAYAHTPTGALIWICISIGGLSASAPIGWSVPSIIAPRGNVRTVAGIVSFSNQLSAIAAPIVTGYIVSATHSYALAFGVSSAYLLIEIGSYIFLLGKIKLVGSAPVSVGLKRMLRCFETGSVFA